MIHPSGRVSSRVQTLLEAESDFHSLVEGDRLAGDFTFAIVDRERSGYKLLFGEERSLIMSRYLAKSVDTEGLRHGYKLYFSRQNRPDTFPHGGFIAHVMPNAVFIDLVKRNAMDCCHFRLLTSFRWRPVLPAMVECGRDYSRIDGAYDVAYWHSVMLLDRVKEVNYGASQWLRL